MSLGPEMLLLVLALGSFGKMMKPFTRYSHHMLDGSVANLLHCIEDIICNTLKLLLCIS